MAAVLRELERESSKQYRADMRARYGIVTKAVVYGTPVSKLRKIAKRIGYDHALAEALWKSGVHDARMLATMVADPAKVTPAQMRRLARDFDNWGIVDTACFGLFDHSPHAFAQIELWVGARDEFVKRAAFALLACCVLHRQGGEREHLEGLKLIEREASDPRNFVKKGASWALRALGRRGVGKARTAARALAKKLSASEDSAERWIGKNALRDFAKIG